MIKQQGHYYDVAASAFSPDGAYLVTGADDAKVSDGCGCRRLRASFLLRGEPLSPLLVPTAGRHISHSAAGAGSADVWCPGMLLLRPLGTIPARAGCAAGQGVDPGQRLLLCDLCRPRRPRDGGAVPGQVGVPAAGRHCVAVHAFWCSQTGRGQTLHLCTLCAAALCPCAVASHVLQQPRSLLPPLPLPLRSGHAVLSASLDGTVRAFDLVRYRNFRTLTTPSPVQFVSLAADPAGDVSRAGAKGRWAACGGCKEWQGQAPSHGSRTGAWGVWPESAALRRPQRPFPPPATGGVRGQPRLLPDFCVVSQDGAPAGRAGRARGSRGGHAVLSRRAAAGLSLLGQVRAGRDGMYWNFFVLSATRAWAQCHWPALCTARAGRRAAADIRSSSRPRPLPTCAPPRRCACRTVRTWDVFSGKGAVEALEHQVGAAYLRYAHGLFTASLRACPRLCRRTHGPPSCCRRGALATPACRRPPS